tara:strand:- start:1070 stop:1183 length:114 start_codon:yes stop_codon:yes gene_type:complete
LSRTVDELIDQMSVEEFAEWAAYFEWKNQQQRRGGDG